MYKQTDCDRTGLYREKLIILIWLLYVHATFCLPLVITLHKLKSLTVFKIVYHQPMEFLQILTRVKKCWFPLGYTTVTVNGKVGPLKPVKLRGAVKFSNFLIKT